MGHFADECYSDIKKKGKEEKINVTHETKVESALMMVVSDEYVELLLQGTSDSYDDRLWYLVTRASSHMMGKKSFFHKIDENDKERAKFGDVSTTLYEGNISVTFKTSDVLIIPSVLYLPDLKTNILNLGNLDDQGCKTILSSVFLTIHDKFGRLLTNTKKTLGNMYKQKININENCNLTKKDTSEAWLWHKRFCH